MSEPTARGDELPAALGERLGFLLGRAHLAHRHQAEGWLSSVGLTGKELGALSVLAEDGPLSQQRLGERMGVDRTTMVAVARRLEEQALVGRHRNPSDRRAYVLEVTTAGRRVLVEATGLARRAEEEFLHELSTAEQIQLRDLLRRLIDSWSQE